jgi:transcriptional regulator with XRE-family HTH domain
MLISQNLKYLMKSRKISLIELAKSSGVPKSSIHDWTQGSSPKNLLHLKKVSDVLGLTIDELLFSDVSLINEKTSASIFPKSEHEIVDGLFRVRITKVE